jgi:hypothetical protein
MPSLDGILIMRAESNHLQIEWYNLSGCPLASISAGTNLRSNTNEQETLPGNPEPNKVMILTHVKVKQNTV